MTNHLAHSLGNRLYIDLPFAIFPIIAHCGKNKPWIQSCYLQLTTEDIPVCTTAALIVLMGSTDCINVKKNLILVCETITVVVVILRVTLDSLLHKNIPPLFESNHLLSTLQRSVLTLWRINNNI